MSGTLRTWIRENGFQNPPSGVWVFDETKRPWKYMPWKSQWARAQSWYYWAKRILRQVSCPHPYSYHGGSGRVSLTLEEAKFKFDPFDIKYWKYGKTIPAVRINHRCGQCRRWLRAVWTLDYLEYDKLTDAYFKAAREKMAKDQIEGKGA